MYEVAYHRHEGGRLQNWAIWARVLKELSQVLLVAYSAFNPVAYCGDLVMRGALKAVLPKAIFNKVYPKRKTCFCCFCCCCCCFGAEKEQSELERMESAGITMGGCGSVEKQLEDLDPQSRILSGLKPKMSSGKSESV